MPKQDSSIQSQLIVIALIVAAVISRLIPHPPNFSPVEATALFAGAYIANKRWALIVPLLIMLLSDFFIGFHDLMPQIYACMLLIGVAGIYLGKRVTGVRVAAFALASAVFFFAVSNFFVWLGSGMYTQNLQGLVACYVAAIPFFQNSLAGVAVYSTLLFGGYALIQRQYPALQKA